MTGEAARRTLIIFGREPRPGHVKTRLIPALGAERAAELYRRLLFKTLVTAVATPADHRALWLDVSAASSKATVRAQKLGLAVHRQEGADLGQRMAYAFDRSLSTDRVVVLIGSDCPEYTPAYISGAFDALRDADAVIGPADDGGYVLLGLRRQDPLLFDDIEWGTDQVLDATRRRLTRLGWTWQELRTLHDLDRPEDLDRVPSLAADRAGVPSPPGQGLL